MLSSIFVYLFRQASSRISRLLAMQDMEIVICRVPPSMALCAYRAPKDNEVFRDTRMDDIHSSHSAARIVEDLRRRWARYAVIM